MEFKTVPYKTILSVLVGLISDFSQKRIEVWKKIQTRYQGFFFRLKNCGLTVLTHSIYLLVSGLHVRSQFTALKSDYSGAEKKWQ